MWQEKKNPNQTELNWTKPKSMRIVLCKVDKDKRESRLKLKGTKEVVCVCVRHFWNRVYLEDKQMSIGYRTWAECLWHTSPHSILVNNIQTRAKLKKKKERNRYAQ